MKEIGAAALTLLPQDSFELRLRCLNNLYQPIDLLSRGDDNDENTNVIEYQLYIDFDFDYDMDLVEPYLNFLMEDTRYEVEDGGPNPEESNSPYRSLFLQHKGTKGGNEIRREQRN
jgi:hypothetical protein